MWCGIPPALDRARPLCLGVMQGRGGNASPVVLPPTPLHSCVTGLVDNDRLPGLVNVMVHAKVGSYAVQQHPVV